MQSAKQEKIERRNEEDMKNEGWFAKNDDEKSKLIKIKNGFDIFV